MYVAHRKGTCGFERVKNLMNTSRNDAGEWIGIPSVSGLGSFTLHGERLPGSSLAICEDGAIVS